MESGEASPMCGCAPRLHVVPRPFRTEYRETAALEYTLTMPVERPNRT